MRGALCLMVLSPSLVEAQLRGRAAAVSQARSSAPLLGKHVITKYAKPLRVGNDVVDDGTAFRICQVGQAKGDWLWLESGRVRGWAKTGDVVPLSQGIDHFTSQITIQHIAA